MTSSQRRLRWGVLLLLVALPAMPASARTHHNATHHSGSHHGESWARDHFAAAERMREALNGRPPADRTRRDYQRVINAYRNVYFGAPTSSKADPSVVAVAETLVEMGRRFDDDKILNEAIAPVQVPAASEYPGSKYRCDALFTIGEIYKDDLNDPEQARATFQEFLHRYPHNRLVEDAQQAIAELDREARPRKRRAEEAAPRRRPSKPRKTPELRRDQPAEQKAGKQSLDDAEPQRRHRLPAEDAEAHASTPQAASGHRLRAISQAACRG